MSLLNLNRIAPDSDDFESQVLACEGCSGCGDRPRIVTLPLVRGDSAVIELSLTAQWGMLWNSWMKPLFATVIAAVGSESLSLSEPLTVGLALTAFLAGYLVCCAVPRHALKISEKLHEETDCLRDATDDEYCIPNSGLGRVP
jgi:hypothetical protein